MYGVSFMHKLISVIIPTFNRGDSTDRAIASVISTRPDLVEIIVVDDCGSEIYTYADRTNMHGISVRVIRAAVNGGPGMARKIGVDQSLAKMVTFLDSDDTFDSQWLDKVIGKLLDLDISKLRRVMLVGQPSGSSAFIRVASHVISAVPDRLVFPFCRSLMTMFNPFCTGTVVMSRDICQFHKSLRFCEDYYTNALAIFSSDGIVVLRKNLSVVIHRAPGSQGGASGRHRDMRRGERQVKLYLLRSKAIPIMFRMMIPIGMLYMEIRCSAQSVLRRLLG
jgi:glycosyltransferase involved in cell wall biosynthesis